jgi:hypothetical protein
MHFLERGNGSCGSGAGRNLFCKSSPANIALNRIITMKRWSFSVSLSPLNRNSSTIKGRIYNSGEISMDENSIDEKSMDKDETEKKELAAESGRLAELKADKAREARRWQRKRETIKRFAGMK